MAAPPAPGGTTTRSGWGRRWRVRLHWRDVTTGALVTAVLFAIGQQLIGFYLGQSSMATAYGAAGSMMVLLFGAEFTRVYAAWRGVKPKPGT